MRPSFFHHLHPPTIPAPQARFRYTLAAGGMAVFLMLVLLLTGILETFYYIPTPDQAATSIQAISFLVPFGGLVRNLHFWSAQFLVIVCVIHLIRVIFTGGYAPPRQVNYLLGMGLFILAVFLDFTGYVLRWDEGIHWALVTGINLVRSIPLVGIYVYPILVGGPQPGAATLVRFYAGHIFGLSIPAGILVVWHIFRLRRDGGIAVPPPPLRQSQARITRYQLFQREVLAILLISSGLLLLSLFVPAPLAAPISTLPPVSETVHAPWFFLWIQQMLRWGDPFLWGVVVPLAVLVLFSILPNIFPKPIKAELGRWFPKSNRIAQVVASLLLLIILFLTVLALFPNS
jgi:quinol-cytochrome oxidoreductase complex cytochrome b subunit